MGKKKRIAAKKAAEASASTSAPAPASAPAHSISPGDKVDPGVLASVLAAEFPLIDPSLVHAILLDYDPDTLASHIGAIRDQLGILEATSVPDTDEPDSFLPSSSPQLGAISTSDFDCKAFNDTSALPSPVHSAFGYSTQSTRLGTTIPSASGASTSSPSLYDDDDDPQTEQELLASFFPALPRSCIDEALAAEPSLDAAIDHLLSVELIRGVKRTGMWPGEAEELESDAEFTIVKSRRGSSNSGQSRSSDIKPTPRPKAKKAATVTIPLVDTLQRRTAPPPRSGSASGSSTPRTPGLPSSDVWSAFASLAAYLADILPRAQVAWFTSFLHSPDYSCAHEAVLASLSTLASSARIDAIPDDATTIVEDIYGMSLGDDNAHDLELCLRAAEGDIAVVMDLMDLLSELTWWPDYIAARDFGRDPFEQLAELERALPSPRASAPNTRPPSTEPQPEQAATTRVVNSNRLQRPKSEQPKTRERVVPGSRPVVNGFTAATPFSALPKSGRWVAAAGDTPKGTVPWQQVAKAQNRPRRSMHPLAASIPAYARGMLPHDQRPGTLAAAQRAESSSTGAATASMCYERSEAEWRRREAAIRAAAQHFKSGGRRDQTAVVAGHYAAQARAAGDAAREWELRGARIVVDAQMDRTGHTVDLHYATVDQAITLARETAQRWWRALEDDKAVSATIGAAGAGFRPLIVVTGKGRHSAGQRGVLGPAVARALADDGWRVEKAEGYLAIKGRK